MQVILKQKVENLGGLGVIVNVKPGYARNYLIPYGKAVRATKENIAIFEKQKAELERFEAQRLLDAKKKAEKIIGQIFRIKAQAGEGGKLFGSVGAKEIIEVIRAQTSIEVEKKHVRIHEGIIRMVGEFKLSIHLHTDVDAETTLVVEADA